MKRMLLTSFISLLSVATYAMNTNSVTTNKQNIVPSKQEVQNLLKEIQKNAKWHAPTIIMPTPKTTTVPTSKYLISPANINKIMQQTNEKIIVRPLTKKEHYTKRWTKKYTLITPLRTDGGNKELILIPYNSKRT